MDTSELSDAAEEIKKKYDYDVKDPGPKVATDKESKLSDVLVVPTTPGSYFYLLGFLRGMTAATLLILVGIFAAVYVQVTLSKEDDGK